MHVSNEASQQHNLFYIQVLKVAKALTRLSNIWASTFCNCYLEARKSVQVHCTLATQASDRSPVCRSWAGARRSVEVSRSGHICRVWLGYAASSRGVARHLLPRWISDIVDKIKELFLLLLDWFFEMVLPPTVNMSLLTSAWRHEINLEQRFHITPSVS